MVKILKQPQCSAIVQEILPQQTITQIFKKCF